MRRLPGTGRARWLASCLAVVATFACRTAGVALPPADAIVEGRTSVAADTIDAEPTMHIDRGHWTLRDRPVARGDFWADVSVLDVAAADRDARSLDERTFSVALRTLMLSDPEGAAVAFQALRLNGLDATIRARARIGLTMALSWQSDWPSLARIGASVDTADAADSLNAQASVERWGQAFAQVTAPVIDVPAVTVTLPLRRSALGTPVVTVRVNGREHEFWLDTGASMTLLSADVAVDAGVRLAASDTLALGVVAGHIPARAVFIDSLSIGPVIARGLGAALVSRSSLRLDHRVVNGLIQTINIDGVIGTDLLRHLDLVIDAGAGTITLRRPRPDPHAVRNLFWVGYPVVRLVTRDGRPALFGLDTGAEGTYVTTALLKKEPGTPVAMRRGTISGLGTDVHHTEWVARDVALSDGDYAMTLRNIPVLPERRWTFVTFDGVIGSDVALTSRLHLDFVNGVFDIRPSASVDRGVSVGQ